MKPCAKTFVFAKSRALVGVQTAQSRSINDFRAQSRYCLSIYPQGIRDLESGLGSGLGVQYSEFVCEEGHMYSFEKQADVYDSLDGFDRLILGHDVTPF